MIRVDTDVPLPRDGLGRARPPGRASVYPWRRLGVGHSFFTERDGIKNRLSSVGQVLGIRLISRRVQEGGVWGRRVWRVE